MLNDVAQLGIMTKQIENSEIIYLLGQNMAKDARENSSRFDKYSVVSAIGIQR